MAQLADEHGVSYLDAPVSGSTTPARQGKLVWLVAGDDAALDRVRPVLDALGQAVLHVGTGVEGSALKLAVNAWMATATVAMSDVLWRCATPSRSSPTPLPPRWRPGRWPCRMPCRRCS